MKRVFRNLGMFTVRNRWFVIVACLLLMIPLMVAASQIKMATGIDTYVPTESQEYQDFDRFSQHFSGSTIAVMLTGHDLPQLLQPDVLSSMEYVESQMAESARVISTIGPTLLIKQAVAQQSGTPALPQDLQTLLYIVTDPQTGEVRPEFDGVFPDDSHAIIAIVLDGGLTMEEEQELADEAIDTVEAAGFSGVDVIVSGAPVLMGQIQEAMDSNLRNMLTLSIFIMLIILAVVFGVRGFFAWRWMPLAVVGLAIIYTFGVMGLIGVQMTMVTMSVFPILIGLGIDYAIQIHNRFDEEFDRNRTVGGAMVKAVTHIGPAIGLALIAACLGFTALFFSPVPMVRDFGLMLIIGVAACYVLGVCFTSAVLSRRHRDAEPVSPADRQRSMRKKERINLGIGLGAACVGVALIFLSRDPSAILPESMVKDAEFTLIIWAVAHFLVAAFFVGAVIHRRRNHSGGDEPPVTKNREREHLLERGLRRLAPWVIKGTVVIIPLALLLSIGGFVADPHVETETDETKFGSQDLPAIQDYRTLEEVSSGFVSANLLIEAEDVTDPAILSWVLQVEQGINSGLPDEITGTSSIAALVMQATGGAMPQSSAEVKAVLSMLPEQTTSTTSMMTSPRPTWFWVWRFWGVAWI